MHRIEFVTGILPDVIRVNECTVSVIDDYDGVIFSPGPGLPSEIVNLLSLVSHACSSKVVLGVCLGHQAIAQSFGAELYRQEQAYHGIARKAINRDEFGMFEHFKPEFEAGSYHSWSVKESNFPSVLTITSSDDEHRIISFKHMAKPVWAVQFHPESVLSPDGDMLIKNWIKLLN